MPAAHSVPCGQGSDQLIRVSFRVPGLPAEAREASRVGCIVKDALDEAGVHQQAMGRGFAAGYVAVSKLTVDQELFAVDGKGCEGHILLFPHGPQRVQTAFDRF